jgi:hypothetical protein
MLSKYASVLAVLLVISAAATAPAPEGGLGPYPSHSDQNMGVSGKTLIEAILIVKRQPSANGKITAQPPLLPRDQNRPDSNYSHRGIYD